jgi:hypothetical protein
MEIQHILKTLLFTPGPNGHMGIPVLLEGPPGSGKSSIVEQMGEEWGLLTKVVIASIREPADFSGLPIPQEDHVSSMPVGWAWELAQAGRGIAFLDELNTAPEAVQAALLRVVLDRAVGDLQLPSGVRIIAAQNSVEEATGGHDLAAPLANRFLHWTWEAPSVTEWMSWVLGGGMDEKAEVHDPVKEEDRVRKAWPIPFAKAKGLVTGFIHKRQALIHAQPKVGDPQSSKAWPSRRTWELAMRVLAGSGIHNLGPVETEMLLAGCVGEAAMAEFIAYEKDADLPDPAKLLDGEEKWAPDKRLDRTLAVLSSCAALVTPRESEKRKDRAEALWGLMGNVAKDAPDVALPSMKALVKAKLSGSSVAKSAMLKLAPIYAKTGSLA